MIRFLRLFAAFGLALFAQGGIALAQNGALPDAERHVQASFIPERASIAPGTTVTVALREIIRKNWHTYWINPGDAGAPTSIDWSLPQGWTASAIQWPYPSQLPVRLADVSLMDFGYTNDVALLTDITAPKDAKPGDTVTLNSKVLWLVCSDVCVPEGPFDMSVSLPVTAALPPADAKSAPLFAETRSKLPHASPWKAVYDAGDKRFALLVQSPELAAARPKQAVFYPYTNGQLEGAVPQKAGTAANGLVIEATTGFKLATQDKRAGVDRLGGVLVLTGADGRTDALDIEAQPGTVPASAVMLSGDSGVGLFGALLFAFLGGLILNLMPCVFPVLSMKALALAAKRDSPAAAKSSALAYGAGAMLSFAVLALVLIALKGAGAAIGWGFQLQQPLFVAVLALVMFAVGLNLFGLFEIGGGRFANAGGKLAGREGAAGSFFTGVLAVVVATPCTAPFMGAAMGFALAQNTVFALPVFLSLGAGFAAPFVLLGFSPGALRLLPRPGAWMGTLRQVLAFPMFGAAIWLVWVLSFQAGSNGVLWVLSSALALTFGLWVYGRSRHAHRMRRTAGFATVAASFIVTAMLAAQVWQVQAVARTSQAQATDSLGYEPYTAAKLAALRAEGRPVFINATAAWCITCLLNEKVALSGDKLKAAFAERKVAALKADWTNADSDVTALLSSQGRSGVPLYLYFAPGANTPVILPQLLTESTVLAQLDSAR